MALLSHWRSLTAILISFAAGIALGIYAGKPSAMNIEPHRLKQRYTLLTWKSHSGEVCFAMVPQYKSMRFVENPFNKWGGQCGISKLKEDLSMLPKDTYVEWVNWSWFPYPSEAVTSDVMEFAKSKGVELTLEPVLR